MILDVISNSIEPYTDADKGEFKRIVTFHCIGMEPTDFSPRVNTISSKLTKSWII